MSEPNRIDGYAQITTHVVDGLAQMYIQFHANDFVQALESSYMARVQELENALWDLLVNTTLDTATGDALAQIGKLLAQPAGIGWSDDVYRLVLKAIIRARRSSGTAEDVYAVATLLADSAITFDYDSGRASILLTFHYSNTWILPVDAMMSVLQSARLGGVQLQASYQTVPDSGAFLFSDDPYRVESSAANGFSDTTRAIGGALNGVVT